MLTYFGTTNINANADPTGKGMTIGQDYVAGTDPNNINSVLRITAAELSSGGTIAILKWNSEPTRLYYILGTTNVVAPVWLDSSLGLIAPFAGATTTAGFSDTKAPMRYYRLQAVLPLYP